MIVALKNTIDTILNKNNQGKISYSEFNSVLPVVISEIQSDIFEKHRKMNFRKMRFQDTPNYGDEASVIKQAIEYYIGEKEDLILSEGKANLIQLIEDYYVFNSAFNNKARIEKVDLLEFNTLHRINSMNPTTCLPICTLNSNVLKVSPEETKIDIVYYRKAKVPKLTYRIINGIDVIDDSQPDFEDLDIHPVMYHAVFIELLLYLGVNLKDEFSVQLASNLQQEELAKQQQ